MSGQGGGASEIGNRIKEHRFMFALERAARTATLTLCSPPNNELSVVDLRQLRSLLEDLQWERQLMALVITGEGGRYFSAGADLQGASRLKDAAYIAQNASAFTEAFQALQAFPVLTIAAINGLALGGGLELALACDLRVADENAILALPEARLGMTPCGGGTLNLPWLVGPAWAKRMILCGEYVKAAKAKEIGLVDEVCAPGEAVVRANAFARQAALQSPDASRVCKSLIDATKHGFSRGDWDQQRLAFVEIMECSNAKEGVDSFFERREPHWSYEP
jgi:enoyl-CoA hydratase/carnithine racemase